MIKSVTGSSDFLVLFTVSSCRCGHQDIECGGQTTKLNEYLRKVLRRNSKNYILFQL